MPEENSPIISPLTQIALPYMFKTNPHVSSEKEPPANDTVLTRLECASEIEDMFPWDETLMAKWAEAHNPGFERKMADFFLEQIKLNYVSFETFIRLLSRNQRTFEQEIHGREYFAIVPNERPTEGSNIWALGLAQMSASFAPKAIIRVNDIVNYHKANPKVSAGIYYDDAMYTGSQVSTTFSHFHHYRIPLNGINLYLNIPLYTAYAHKKLTQEYPAGQGIETGGTFKILSGHLLPEYIPSFQERFKNDPDYERMVERLQSIDHFGFSSPDGSKALTLTQWKVPDFYSFPEWLELGYTLTMPRKQISFIKPSYKPPYYKFWEERN